MTLSHSCSPSPCPPPPHPPSPLFGIKNSAWLYRDRGETIFCQSMSGHSRASVTHLTPRDSPSLTPHYMAALLGPKPSNPQRTQTHFARGEAFSTINQSKQHIPTYSKKPMTKNKQRYSYLTLIYMLQQVLYITFYLW